MKAIIPAAGFGTRFLPATKAQPKEMPPIYDKPTIQYLVEDAISSGIKDILIISTPRDLRMYKNLLGDGSSLGINFEYKAQEKSKRPCRSVHHRRGVHWR